MTKLVEERKSSVRSFDSTIKSEVKTVSAELKSNSANVQESLRVWNEEVGVGADGTTATCKSTLEAVESQTGEQIAKLLTVQDDVESLVEKQLKKDISSGKLWLVIVRG